MYSKPENNAGECTLLVSTKVVVMLRADMKAIHVAEWSLVVKL